MPYMTIAGTTYAVAVANGRGKSIEIENRRRALDGTLLVDTTAQKKEITVEILGTASDPLTISTADSLIAVLRGGNVAVAGDVGSFTARARDVGWRDVKTGAGVKRFVTATLEQV